MDFVENSFHYYTVKIIFDLWSYGFCWRPKNLLRTPKNRLWRNGFSKKVSIKVAQQPSDFFEKKKNRFELWTQVEELLLLLVKAIEKASQIIEQDQKSWFLVSYIVRPIGRA